MTIAVIAHRPQVVRTVRPTPFAPAVPLPSRRTDPALTHSISAHPAIATHGPALVHLASLRELNPDRRRHHAGGPPEGDFELGTKEADRN